MSVKRNPAAKDRGLPPANHEIAKFGAHAKVAVEPVVQSQADVADTRRREETGGGGVTTRDEKVQLPVDRRIRNVIVPVDGEGGEAAVAHNQTDLGAQPNSFPENKFSAHRRVADE